MVKVKKTESVHESCIEKVGDRGGKRLKMIATCIVLSLFISLVSLFLSIPSLLTLVACSSTTCSGHELIYRMRMDRAG
ncbi:hypothetical protein Ancab_016383 [Ancistrocladus abbreviatus]